MTRRGTNGSGAGGSLGQTLARRRSGRAKSNGSTAAGANGAGTSETQGSGLELLPVINLAPDHPCVDCAQCCHYVAIEIDAPTTMTEYDYMLWYLVHPGVSVFVDFDNAWFVKFDSRCQHLQPNGMCGIYETRPVICREFDWKECERHLVDEPADKWLFTGADAFLAWFEKQRPRTYKKFLAFQKEHRRKKTPKELRRVKITALPLPPP